MDLNDKNAVITGASRGVGAAFVKTLIEKGVHVYGLARSLDALNNLQDHIGNHFTPVRMDITDRDTLEGWITRTFSDENTPHILINNAGSGQFGKIDDMGPEQWRSMIDTNLNGIYDLTSRIVTMMKKSDNSSHIINMGSILGTVGNPEMSGYCATKFAVRGFSESLFKELRYDNIKVTCLNPGSIQTDFFENAGIQAHNHMLQPKDVAETVVHILETPDNMLINEVTMRPLNPKPPVDGEDEAQGA